MFSVCQTKRKRQIEKISEKSQKIPKMEVSNNENIAEVNLTNQKTDTDNEFASDLHGTDITKDIENGGETGIEYGLENGLIPIKQLRFSKKCSYTN